MDYYNSGAKICSYPQGKWSVIGGHTECQVLQRDKNEDCTEPSVKKDICATNNRSIENIGMRGLKTSSLISILI